MKISRIVAVALAICGMALAGWAASGAQNDDDRRIERAVLAELEEAGLAGEISEVRVEKAVVYLVGKPHSERARLEAIEIALNVEGVEAVEAELEVTTGAGPQPEPVATPSTAPEPATAPAPSADPVSAPEAKDRALVDAIREALEKEKLDEQVADIRVEDGVATLSGTTRNVFLKTKVIETALNVEGVEAVESDLVVAEPESEQDMAREIVKKILTYPQYSVFDDITIGLADGGVVTLGGAVTMDIKRREILERVGTVLGIQELHDEIRLLPANPSDDRLRETLFTRIYSDPMFLGLSERTNPPIHIIVEKGNVTLSGAVSNKVQHRQAELIVRETFGVFKVTNRLTVNP